MSLGLGEQDEEWQAVFRKQRSFIMGYPKIRAGYFYVVDKLNILLKYPFP